MGHGKETPRQKMIGMMYLVLMAMLALNVSNEILNAFDVLDDGLKRTMGTLEQNKGNLMKDFETQNSINPQKVGPWLARANEVSSRADQLVRYIDSLKVMILEGDEAEAIVDKKALKIDATKIKGRDKTDAPARVMVGDKNDKEGKKLREAIEAYKEFLTTEILGDDKAELQRASVLSALNTDADQQHKSETGKSTGLHSWESQHFEHLPVSGVMVIMSGLQINIRNAESEALKYLYGQIEEGEVSFNKIEATVVPNSNYVIQNGAYQASIFLAASDTTADPVIWVTENPNPYDSSYNSDTKVWEFSKRDGLNYTQLEVPKGSGRGIYQGSTGSVGYKNWGGLIELSGSSGKLIKPFKQKYQVAEKFVSVAATKMNVFYVGVENPVDVSVAGVASDKVDISVTNAKMRKSGNSFLITPNRPGNAWVTVYATINGRKQEIDKREFRVKVVPSPVVTLNSQKSGSIRRPLLKALPGPIATMEDFLFDLSFTITEFTIAGFDPRGFFREVETKGKNFSAEQRDFIDVLQLNRTFYIQDVKAVGPGGTTRPLSAANFKLID